MLAALDTTLVFLKTYPARVSARLPAAAAAIANMLRSSALILLLVLAAGAPLAWGAWQGRWQCLRPPLRLSAVPWTGRWHVWCVRSSAPTNMPRPTRRSATPPHSARAAHIASFNPRHWRTCPQEEVTQHCGRAGKLGRGKGWKAGEWFECVLAALPLGHPLARSGGGC